MTVPKHSVFSYSTQVNSWRQPGQLKRSISNGKESKKGVASSMVLHGSGSKQIVGTTLPLELRNARLSMMRMASGYAAKTTAML